MPSLIAQVKSKLFIHSSLKSMHLIDGAYASLLRGRSMDFEDLRKYEYGDEMRDIDWRATARLSTLLVKRSRATRMHTVMFAVDTGRSMAALAPDERPKRELAVLATGALGVLAVRHGDDFRMVYGDSERVRRIAPGRSEGALEHALRRIDGAVSETGPASSRERLLDEIARTVSRRVILVIVTDEAPITAKTERLLRRLRVQHDVLWITLRDADPVLDAPAEAGDGGAAPVLAGRTHPRVGRGDDSRGAIAQPEHARAAEQTDRAQVAGRTRDARATAGHAPAVRARRDVDTGWQIPDFVHGDEEILAELRERREAADAERAGLLTRLRVDHTTLGEQRDAVRRLLRMLHRRAHGA